MSPGVRLWVALGTIGLAIYVTWIGLAQNAEGFLNRVQAFPHAEVSEAARALHDSAFVIDMHADTTVFGRDLLVRSPMGHVDLPRLQEGGVGLQFFTSPTKLPLGMNIDSTDGEMPDVLVGLGWLQGNAFASTGPRDRALLQAQRLEDAAARSRGELVIVRSRNQLEALMAAHEHNPRLVGGLLGTEGAHALEGDLANLDVLFDAGLRMIGLAHFFDNRFTGSAHGTEKGGLTPLGRELVMGMQARGIVVDLAHVSPAALDDILPLLEKPPVVSHTGVKGTCDNLRNLSDRHVRAIAAAGGVIGIGYWSTAVCGIAPSDIAAAMRYVVDLVGDDHVGLGSDYDGGTVVSFDTSDLRVLTQAMLDAGLSPESVRKILGRNVVRVLREVLPRR